MAKHLNSKLADSPYQPALPSQGVFAQRARRLRILTIAAGAGLVVALLAAWLLLPDELPAVWQRLLAIVFSGWALGVFWLATREPESLEAELLRRLHQGQHVDFGKELRARRARRPGINVPGVGRISLRAIGGAAVLLTMGGWWLSPLAPVGVRQPAIDDLTGPLGEEIMPAPLVWPNASVAVLQPPVRPADIRRLADLVPENAEPYDRALWAIVQGRYSEAHAILDSLPAGGSLKPHQVHLARGQAEMFAGRFGEAQAHYAQAVAAKPDDPLLLCQAAVAAMHTGNLADAESLLYRAMRLCEKKKADQRPLGIVLHLQAIVHAGRQSEDAATLSFQAREVFDKDADENGLFIPASFNNQASFYFLRAQHSSAEELFKAALETWTRNLGAGDVHAADAMVNLAVLQIRLGRYALAESQLRRAREILDKQLSPSHSLHALAFAASAALGQARGQTEPARADGQQAMKLVEKRLGPRHASLAGILGTLGDVYVDQARYVRAESQYLRALNIARPTWGPEHPSTADLMRRQANLYILQRRYDEAESLGKQAAKIITQVLGSNHPALADVLVVRARLEIARGRPRQSRTYLEQALRIQQKVFGKEHPDIACAMGLLAALDNSPRTYLTGISQYKKAVRMAEQCQGPGHPEVARLLLGLAALQSQYGQDQEAAECLDRALTIQEASLVPHHPDLATTLDARATLLRKMQPAEANRAAEMEARARSIRQQQAERDQP